MTTYQRYALAVCSCTLLAFSWVLVYKLGRHCASGPSDLPVNVRTDTLVIRDTIREKEPVFLTKYVDRVELVPVTDTIRMTDTLYMAVEIERRTYQGDDYRAVVSGWRPSLDCIEVYPKTVYLQTTVETQAPAARARRFGFGITAGPGALWDGSAIRGGLGVTAGLTVRF